MFHKAYKCCWHCVNAKITATIIMSVWLRELLVMLETLLGLLFSTRVNGNQMEIIGTEKSFSFCLKKFHFYASSSK